MLNYSKNVAVFQMEPVMNKYWKGLKTDFHFKNKYLILTGDDIILFVIDKYKLIEKQSTHVDFRAFSNFIYKQTFVKRQKTEHNTTYAFIASKKRVDRLIKQNINRFLIKAK